MSEKKKPVVDAQRAAFNKLRRGEVVDSDLQSVYQSSAEPFIDA